MACHPRRPHQPPLGVLAAAASRGAPSTALTHCRGSWNATAQGERGGDLEGEREGFLGLGDLLGERERPRPPAERGGDFDLAGDLERLRSRLGLRAGDLRGTARRTAWGGLGAKADRSSGRLSRR